MKFWLSREESRRLQDIAHVLFKNHLGSALNNLRLRKKLPFEKRLKTPTLKEKEMTPELLLKIFEELDGSFIKLGQLLALRPDLIPAEYCEELSKLQDEVKPFPGEDAVRIIENEFGKGIYQLFKNFDKKPIAAASMGQVHIATLKDGTRVAVKVQRPGVERTVKIDIKLLYRLAHVMRRRYPTDVINPVEIVHEFERYTESELNYLKEAHNIDLFHKHFDGSKTLVIPKVRWSHSKGRVLTMDYIPGKRLTDLNKFKPAQRKKIIQSILEAEFEQIFEHGIFHADPHPGNFVIKRNGKIALLDYGIIGRLDYAMREHVTDFFVCMVGGDAEGMVDNAMRLGVTPRGADLAAIRADVRDRLSTYHGVSLDKVKMSSVMNDVIRLLKENNIKILPNFVLLSKATVTLEGLAKRMDPKLNFIEVAKPYVKKLARQRMNPKLIAERARRKIETMLDFAQTVPQKADMLLTELHDTSRDLRRIDVDIGALAVEIDRSSNRLTLGFLAGTLFIASTVLLPFQAKTMFGMPALSFIGYTVALIVMLSIFVSILREKKI